MYIKYKRSFIPKGKSLLSLEMKTKAKEVLKAGLEIEGDLFLLKMLRECVEDKKKEETQEVPKVDIMKEVVKETKESEEKKPESRKSKESEGESKVKKGGGMSNKKPLSADSVNKASTLAANEGLVQHGTGETMVDKHIASGYLYVNTGNYSKAIELFSSLLNMRPKLIAAHLGRGTALALSGQIEASVLDFSAAIKIDKKCAEGWKRRGQAHNALGRSGDALYDLTRAIELCNDADSHYQRGLFFMKTKNVKRAAVDFEDTCRIDPTHKLSSLHSLSSPSQLPS